MKHTTGVTSAADARCGMANCVIVASAAVQMGKGLGGSNILRKQQFRLYKVRKSAVVTVINSGCEDHVLLCVVYRSTHVFGGWR